MQQRDRTSHWMIFVKTCQINLTIPLLFSKPLEKKKKKNEEKCSRKNYLYGQNLIYFFHYKYPFVTMGHTSIRAQFDYISWTGHSISPWEHAFMPRISPRWGYRTMPVNQQYWM